MAKIRRLLSSRTPKNRPKGHRLPVIFSPRPDEDSAWAPLDRNFFQSNPEQLYRIRPLLKGELDDWRRSSAKDPATLEDCRDPRTAVLVIKLSTTRRFRCPVILLGEDPFRFVIAGEGRSRVRANRDLPEIVEAYREMLDLKHNSHLDFCSLCGHVFLEGELAVTFERVGPLCSVCVGTHTEKKIHAISVRYPEGDRSSWTEEVRERFDRSTKTAELTVAGQK